MGTLASRHKNSLREAKLFVPPIASLKPKIYAMEESRKPTVKVGFALY